MPLIAVALTVTMLTLQASSAPDFSGTWKMVADRSGSPTQSEPVNEQTLNVQQGPTEVRLEWAGPKQAPIVATYPIGPAPKQPAEPLGADQSRAYWDGNRLVLERGGTISGQTVSTKQSLTSDPARSELILERVVIVQHGYTLRGTKNFATVKDVFVRVAQ